MKNDYVSEIHKKDKLVLHPYEDMESRGTYDRKLIVKSDNIYLYDENGKEYIDGPGGMWCNNIGHGNKEIGEDVKNELHNHLTEQENSGLADKIYNIIKEDHEKTNYNRSKNILLSKCTVCYGRV